MSRAASRPSLLPAVSGANDSHYAEGDNQDKPRDSSISPVEDAFHGRQKRLHCVFQENQCSFQNVIFPFLFHDREARLCNKKNEPLGAAHTARPLQGELFQTAPIGDYNSGFTFLNN